MARFSGTRRALFKSPAAAAGGSVTIEYENGGEVFGSLNESATVTDANAILLYVGHTDSDAFADSVKWNTSESFTRISGAWSNSGYFEWWALLNPTAGTHNVAVDMTTADGLGNSRRQYQYWFLTGVDQSSLGTAFQYTDTQSTASPVTVNITGSSVGGLVFAAGYGPGSATAITFSAPGAFTYDSGTVGWYTISRPIHADGDGGTVACTAVGQDAALWGVSGVAVKPA